MHGATQPNRFGAPQSARSTKNIFSQGGNSSVGRSRRPPQSRRPSRLSKSMNVDDDEENGEVTASQEQTAPRTFAVRYSDDSGSQGSDEEEMEEDMEEAEEGQDNDAQDTNGFNGGYTENASFGEADQPEDDVWLNIDHDRRVPPNLTERGESDFMMMATPEINARVKREAQAIYDATTMQTSRTRKQRFDFAGAARALYEQPQMQYALLTEPPDVILSTENLIDRLYEEGIGKDDDPERMDDTLASVAGLATSSWRAAVENLPQPDEEHAAGIGPGPQATPFEQAAYLATFALRVHHTRCDEFGRVLVEPLPETMFRWLSDSHNLYPNQVQDVLRHKPSPACHSLYWQTVSIALLRGCVEDAQTLLDLAGWEHIQKRPRGTYIYQGQALDNVQRAARETVAMLDACPGRRGEWDIWNSNWTLFRIRAKGSWNQLARFAEGKDRPFAPTAPSTMRGHHSLAGRAREAESLVPWEIYENLNIIFDIVLGNPKTILDTAQDWCEATVGLFGWWDEDTKEKRNPLAQTQSLMLLSQPPTNPENYIDRLSRAFHFAVRDDFQVNTLNPVEVGMACVFEDNARAVVGLLRSWSLPIASAVANISSLGGWLPSHVSNPLSGIDDLDAEDLRVLGINPSNPDESDGVKDNTLIQYAQELINYEDLGSVSDRNGIVRDGWELAMDVLGRMDSADRSEETIGELVRAKLEDIGPEDGDMVDRFVQHLSYLGMAAFAEDTAEHYGNVLIDTSRNYGEAAWYYAQAHKPAKVREVMNLLISRSLVQSSAYPAAQDMDEYLSRMLKERRASLEHLGRQDVEAAELLGRLLSGYATLRKFYEIRDDESMSVTRRQKAAAAALSVVIASSDESIRGGLYDITSEAIVSECFLLALLGEALVFVNKAPAGAGVVKAVLDLQQLNILLKSIEDIETVGERVFSASEEFFDLVLASAHGMKGSAPTDLVKSGSAGLSMMAGSTILASQLHKDIGEPQTKRGWDWRSEMRAGQRAREVLDKLRTGLTKELAKLWLDEADCGI